jgi:hypothetical protein
MRNTLQPATDTETRNQPKPPKFFQEAGETSEEMGPMLPDWKPIRRMAQRM